jgi:hypothetical protein
MKQSHYCADWDEMFITPKTPEMDCCGCLVASFEVTAKMVKELREKTGAGMQECKEALEVRAGDMEFAQEYVERAGLAVVMSDQTRFPKWFAYLRKMNSL